MANHFSKQHKLAGVRTREEEQTEIERRGMAARQTERSDKRLDQVLERPTIALVVGICRRTDQEGSGKARGRTGARMACG